MAHHHSHCNNQMKNQRTLVLSFWLIFTFMFVEWVAGFLVNSLALMADAGHMTNDAFSLAIAYFALRLTGKHPKIAKYLTLVNGISLILVAIFIIWEAIMRFHQPKEILALPMMFVAIIGLVINIIVANIMHSGDANNLNIQAAYWHVLADLFGSVIAIFAGFCAYFFRWQWVDPLASGILSFVILQSGYRISLNAYRSLS